MYKPDEKDIDRLSREAAEHYHAPGQPAWDALQQRLDKELPQEKEKKRRGFFFYFLLLLGLAVAGSGVWYGMRNNSHKITLSTDPVTKSNTSNRPVNPSADQHDKENNQPIKNSVSPSGASVASNGSAQQENELPGTRTASASLLKSKAVSATEKTGTKASTVPATAAATANTIAREKNKLSVKATRERTSMHLANRPAGVQAAQPVANNILEAIDREATNSGNQHLNRKSSNRKTAYANTKTKTNSGKKNGTAPASALAETNSGDESSATAKNTDVDNTTAGSPVAGTSPQTQAASADTTVDKKAAVTKDDAANNQQKKDSVSIAVNKKNKKERAFTVSLLAGMDLSTVKFTHNSTIGYNIGLMAGYQFSRHWSVTTGIIYTKKNYALNGTDYHPPQHYWTQYVKLETVAGYCRMWELPVLARYSFKAGAKTNAFVSTGLSSYFMKKQQYEYSYKNNMSQPMTSAWSNDSSFNHVFSILHLSAGIEKPLGKHMNWQIEPYAKIPLGGVGFGNIRLSSFGINFSVQYRKALKR